jgi:hypothetical protein
VTLLEVEPSGRTLTDAALRWRHRVRFAFAGWVPLELFRDLEGVVWNCPDCGTSGALVLRTRHTPFRRYWFRCGHCHREREVDPTIAENLVIALGAPARKGRPPRIEVWVDSENNPHASIDGKEHPLG